MFVRLALEPGVYSALGSLLFRWNPDMGCGRRVQAILGEPFATRDRIRNPFKSFSFLEFSTGSKGASSPLLLGSSARYREPSRRETRHVAHWLMKSEPESYGWADLERDGAT